MSSSGLANRNVGEKTRSWEWEKGYSGCVLSLNISLCLFTQWTPKEDRQTEQEVDDLVSWSFLFCHCAITPTPGVSKESCHGDKEVDYVWAKRWSYFNIVSYIILMETVILQGSHLAEDYPGFQESHHFLKLSHSTKLEYLFCLFRHLL